MKAKAFHQAGLMSNNYLHNGIMEALNSGLAVPGLSAKRKATASSLTSLKKLTLLRTVARKFRLAANCLQDWLSQPHKSR